MCRRGRFGGARPVPGNAPMVAAPCSYEWTARDKALGSTGRRLGDPEYNDFVFLRGVTMPRSLADDGAKLLKLKERSIFEYALLCARADANGYGALQPEHIPAEIARMSGPTPVWTCINIQADRTVFEPRWVMRHASGELLGGRLEASQWQGARVLHGTVVHHHHAAPEHIHHNYRSTW